MFLLLCVSASAALAQPAGAPNASSYIHLSDGKERKLDGENSKVDAPQPEIDDATGGGKHKLSIDKLESYALSLINKDRAQAGLGPLPLSKKLSDFARSYAEAMKKDDFFAHQDKQGRGAQERASAAAIAAPVYENLGWQSGDDSDREKLDALNQSFMSEPPGEKNHRYIILKPEHTHVGVGIVRKGDELWMVQEYTDEEP
ncbi:MAG: CAP domain-containing protein [Cyanobacteria bacterium SZAS LIN-2]|nr:CAP domain-containing protein [Cyanobacteria bacterium SZAS LIN-3]MBS1995676.1 CAP domain-containing protein [Cyanobacteria bacterium SZAS LIN-2]